MKIFLDVGANVGQTLEEVVKRRWEFDRIYAFEPMPQAFVEVKPFRHYPRVRLLNYGLSCFTGPGLIYGTNEKCEASIYPTKTDVDESVSTICEFVEASEWFVEHLTSQDQVFMKLNCEGAEIPILTNLCDSGEIHKVYRMMIDFDIRRVEGMEHEADQLLNRFRDISFDRYDLCEHVMVGATHQDRIAHWLEGVK